MARVNFMDGSLSGRLEQIVGVKAKSGDFVRRLVKPHDPQTVDQLARRARVKEVSEWGRRWPWWVLRHPDMVQPYRMTWHNRLMMDNQSHVNGPAKPQEEWQLHDGSLYFPKVFSFTNYVPGGGVYCYYGDERLGEGEKEDLFMLCAHNVTDDTYHHGTTFNRDGSPVDTYVGAENDYFYVFVFCWKPGKNLFSVTYGDFRRLV